MQSNLEEETHSDQKRCNKLQFSILPKIICFFNENNIGHGMKLKFQTETKDFTTSFLKSDNAKVLVSPANEIINLRNYSLIYIPMDDFKVIFNQIGEFVKRGFYEKFNFR